MSCESLWKGWHKNKLAKGSTETGGFGKLAAAEQQRITTMKYIFVTGGVVSSLGKGSSCPGRYSDRGQTSASLPQARSAPARFR